MRHRAATVQRRSFSCSISEAAVRIGRERARLSGRVRFTVAGAGSAGRVRRIDSATLWVVDARGVAYRLLGADHGVRDLGRGDAGRFVWLHRAVLVGSGPLNNRLLTLVIEFTERGGGRATADVFTVGSDSLSPRPGRIKQRDIPGFQESPDDLVSPRPARRAGDGTKAWSGSMEASRQGRTRPRR
jgi:hypothetical protein